MVFNKYTKKTYVLGNNEYSVLINLDGMTGIEELTKKAKYSAERIDKLLQTFEGIGMLDSSTVNRKISIFKLTFCVLNPNKLFKSRLLVNIISSILLYGTLPLLLFGIFLNIYFNNSLVNIFSDIISSAQTPSFLVTIPILLIVTFLHETGHTVAAKRYGVNVPELGIMLYWFMPAAYVNLTGVTLLKKKWQKLVIYLSGIVMNFMILSFILILRPFVYIKFQFLVSWFIADTLLGVIFNLFIFLKLDGYLVLKEMLEIPDLREKAFRYIKVRIVEIVRTRLFNIQSDFKMQTYDDEYTLSEKRMLLCYGFISMMYIPIMLGSITLTIIFTLLV